MINDYSVLLIGQNKTDNILLQLKQLREKFTNFNPLIYYFH